MKKNVPKNLSAQHQRRSETSNSILMENVQSFDSRVRRAAAKEIKQNHALAVTIVSALQDKMACENHSIVQRCQAMVGMIACAPPDLLETSLRDFQGSTSDKTIQSLIALILTEMIQSNKNRLDVGNRVAEWAAARPRSMEGRGMANESIERVQRKLRAAFRKALPELLVNYHGWYVAFVLNENGHPMQFSVDRSLSKLVDKCRQAKILESNLRLERILSNQEMRKLLTETI